MNEKIFQLFSFLSKLEQATQARRKVLNNYYEYNPTKIFKAFDNEDKNYITPENIALFLNNHDIPFTEESLKLLIIFYDTDFDGVLSFQEFISLIQNENILKNKKINVNLNKDELSFNIDYCLAKIFEKEIELNQYIINILTQINKNIGDNLLDIFNGISLNKKYINSEDIMNYLDINKIDYTENQINDIMKRLDINKDGKIDFNEFDYLFGLTNPNNSKKYNLNFRIQPLNNYSNNNDCQSTLNHFTNNENYNYCNEQIDMIKKENSIYKTPLSTQNDGYCIHCINLPCCICHFNCDKSQINDNNNYNSNYSKYNNHNYINNKVNNEELNNNNNKPKNEYESNEKENIFLNSLINDNLYNNDIYYEKNYKYNDSSEKDYNNINYNNNKDYNNKLKNIQQKTFSPIKKEHISNSLSLRKSPVRKNNRNKEFNQKNNNFNSYSSYCYDINNYKSIKQPNKGNLKIKDKNNNYNDFVSSQNYNFNYNPQLKRTYSQGNFIVNKNNILKELSCNNGNHKNNNNNYNFNDNNYNNNTNYKNKNNDNYYNNNINSFTNEKYILIKYFKLIMDGESQIELTKKNLILRKDFNIANIFNLFDEQNKGYITFDDLKNELEFIGLILNDKNIQLLINKFNNDKNRNIIEYNDFYNTIIPINSKMKNNNNENINVFSPTTRLYFKALIKAMVDLENLLNKYKKEKINIKNKKYIEILKEIDIDEKGFINLNELISFIKENGIYSSLLDAILLFSRFDKEKKGKVFYKDILSDLEYI